MGGPGAGGVTQQGLLGALPPSGGPGGGAAGISGEGELALPQAMLQALEHEVWRGLRKAVGANRSAQFIALTGAIWGAVAVMGGASVALLAIGGPMEEWARDLYNRCNVEEEPIAEGAFTQRVWTQIHSAVLGVVSVYRCAGASLIIGGASMGGGASQALAAGAPPGRAAGAPPSYAAAAAKGVGPGVGRNAAFVRGSGGGGASLGGSQGQCGEARLPRGSGGSGQRGLPQAVGATAGGWGAPPYGPSFVEQASGPGEPRRRQRQWLPQRFVLVQFRGDERVLREGDDRRACEIALTAVGFCPDAMGFAKQIQLLPSGNVQLEFESADLAEAFLTDKHNFLRSRPLVSADFISAERVQEERAKAARRLAGGVRLARRPERPRLSPAATRERLETLRTEQAERQRQQQREAEESEEEGAAGQVGAPGVQPSTPALNRSEEGGGGRKRDQTDANLPTPGSISPAPGEEPGNGRSAGTYKHPAVEGAGGAGGPALALEHHLRA